MRNMKRRIEKLEKKTQLMADRIRVSEAKLSKITSQDKDNSLEIALLQLELIYGHKVSLADVFAMVTGNKTKPESRD